MIGRQMYEVEDGLEEKERSRTSYSHDSLVQSYGPALSPSRCSVIFAREGVTLQGGPSPFFFRTLQPSPRSFFFVLLACSLARSCASTRQRPIDQAGDREVIEDFS